MPFTFSKQTLFDSNKRTVVKLVGRGTPDDAGNVAVLVATLTDYAPRNVTNIGAVALINIKSIQYDVNSPGTGTVELYWYGANSNSTIGTFCESGTLQFEADQMVLSNDAVGQTGDIWVKTTGFNTANSSCTIILDLRKDTTYFNPGYDADPYAFNKIPPAFMLVGRTDVATAYSFRQLNFQYTGPLVRIRRPSDNAEIDFSADNTGWISYADAINWAGGTNIFVTKWYNQSGTSGRDLIQATASAQPQIIMAANGKLAALFDGINDNMRTSTFAVNQPWSFNVVYRRLTLLQNNAALFDGLSQNEGSLSATTSFDHILGVSSTGPTSDKVTMPTGTRGAVGGIFNGASSRLEISSLSALSKTTGNVGVGNLTGVTLGFDGNQNLVRISHFEIHELILFSTNHSQAQLQADNAALRVSYRF